MNFKKQLKEYIKCVFKYEYDFIKTFFPHNLTYEVLYFYMAGERCIVKLQKADPGNCSIIETTVDTGDFIDWCDSCGK